MKFEVIASIPRSLFFCFRNLPWKQAVHLPIIIGNGLIIKGKIRRGSIAINVPITKAGMVKLGVGGGELWPLG